MAVGDTSRRWDPSTTVRRRSSTCSKEVVRRLIFAGADMNADVRTASALFSTLRRLAAERPQDARARVGELLDERPPGLSRLLVQIGAPGEGRLRHIVANSI